MIYDFQIPDYIYTVDCIDTEIEYYRMYLMNKLRKDVEKYVEKSKIKITPKIKKKISQYVSQFIMNILTDRTSIFNEKIILEDGLFLIPDKRHLEDFYRDINQFLKTSFLSDEMNIYSKMKNNVHLIQTAYNDTNVLKKYVDKFEKYNLKLGTIPDFIVDKCKKFYKNRSDPNNIMFDTILKCCQIRYASLMSGSNQFMVDLDYKFKLKALGFNFECFGSVFNRYFDNFCSMFYDLEKYFGSCGSFFALKINSGYYMANPPYDDNLLKLMYAKIKKLVVDKRDVCFIMSIPKWEDYSLEYSIDTDNLYLEKMVKHEKFHNPINLKLVTIPPYISYVFVGNDNSFKNINTVIKLFKNFSN